MSRPYTPDELAVGLELILGKSRGSLTVTEIELLTEAIVMLRGLSNPEVMQSNESVAIKAGQVIINLLRFFSCREIIGELMKLL